MLLIANMLTEKIKRTTPMMIIMIPMILFSNDNDDGQNKNESVDNRTILPFLSTDVTQ